MTINNMIRTGMMYNSAINGMYSNLGVSMPFLQSDPRIKPGYGFQLPNPNTNASVKENENTRVAGRSIMDAIKEIYAQIGQAGITDTLAISSDEAKASVVVDSSKTSSLLLSRNFSLDIKQTATAQKNISNVMTADSRDSATGVFSFSIESAGKTSVFSVEVNNDDDNQSIQQKMAAAINKSDIGIKADVSVDKEIGTTVLSLTSKDTGVANSFNVSDTSGNLMSLMGVSEAKEQSRDAVYSVNGGYERTSGSNNVEISSGVTASLKETGKTEISFKSDPSAATKAAKDFVGTVNSVTKDALEANGRGSARLVSDIQNVLRTYSSSLSRAGISVSRTGELVVDDKKLETAVLNGDLKGMFSNRQYGFGARMEQIANNASRSNAYFSPPEPIVFSYSGGKVNYFNYITAGSLFDLII